MAQFEEALPRLSMKPTRRFGDELQIQWGGPALTSTLNLNLISWNLLAASYLGHVLGSG